MSAGSNRGSRDHEARTDRARSERDRAEAQAVHEVASRAIRRLDILEGFMIAGGAVLALLGGAVVAGLLTGIAGLAFRPTWIVASLVLFVVPGAITIIMIRRDARVDARARADDTNNR